MFAFRPGVPPDRLCADASYRQALAWLYSLSLAPRPLEERAHKAQRMRHLLCRLGAPERAYPSVLVVGTKGKGSTAAMLAEIVRATGVRVGRYAQPHLLSWCERTWIDGDFITPAEAASLLQELRPLVEQIHTQSPELGRYTTFEVGTAATLLCFQRRGVDLAVIEAGVGGSGDVGNLSQVQLAVITPISLDHMAVLGNSVAEIAREKAGVIRPSGLVVSAPQPDAARAVVAGLAQERGATLWQVGMDWRWTPADDRRATGRFDLVGPSRRWRNLALPLLGRHQRDNAAVAVAAACLLERLGFSIPGDAIPLGLGKVQWPGRMQVLRERPRVVVDGAHNGDSARCLAQALRESCAFERLVLVLGMTDGKDVAALAGELAPMADTIITTRSSHSRALEPAALHNQLAALGYPAQLAPDPEAALALALRQAEPNDLVCVTGSLFLVGEVLELVAAAAPASPPAAARPYTSGSTSTDESSG